MQNLLFAASAIVATLTTPAWAAQASDVGEMSFHGHGRTIVAQVSSDTKKLYRCRQGRTDRKSLVETPLASWQPASRDFTRLIEREWRDPPTLAKEVITCSTYLIVDAGATAPRCGVVCSDLTSYSMPCKADIFTDRAFDIYGTVN